MVQSLSAPSQKETIVAVEAKGDEKGQAGKGDQEQGEAVVAPVPVAAVVPPANTRDSGADRIGEDIRSDPTVVVMWVWLYSEAHPG